jgi:hypothetical protein
MAGLLLFGNSLRDCNEYIHRQEPHTVLVVASKVLEQKNHLFDDDSSRHGLDEFSQVACSLSPHHRCVIVNKCSILLPQPFLGWWCSSAVGDIVEASRRDLGGKPIGF